VARTTVTRLFYDHLADRWVVSDFAFARLMDRSINALRI
jgi:hypothetical protein